MNTTCNSILLIVYFKNSVNYIVSTFLFQSKDNHNYIDNATHKTLINKVNHTQHWIIFPFYNCFPRLYNAQLFAFDFTLKCLIHFTSYYSSKKLTMTIYIVMGYYLLVNNTLHYKKKSIIPFVFADASQYTSKYI